MAAFELSGAQVSTAPTASFPPTGMGLLMAPLRWAQMSLGDVMQQCQAGALGALGEGLPHGPPNPLASVGENQHLANGRAAPQPLRNSASLGPWGKAKHVLSLQTPQICLGRQLPAGPQAGPALGLPPLGRLPFPCNLKAQFTSPWILTWACTWLLEAFPPLVGPSLSLQSREEAW